MPDAIVHLRIPAATKARWVRESRAAGVRLTDWILQRVVAAVQPRTLDGHPWPVREDRVTDLRDVAKAVLALARAAGVSPQMLAQAMGDNGLPTTAARLKNISTMEQGRRAATSAAELVAMCYAAIAVLNGEKTS